jgi:hypothetical protein
MRIKMKISRKDVEVPLTFLLSSFSWSVSLRSQLGRLVRTPQEHLHKSGQSISKYLYASIFFRTSSPYPTANSALNGAIYDVNTSCQVTAVCPLLPRSSVTLGSHRRSFINPTSIIGTPGQICSTSLIHCDKSVGGTYGRYRESW